jgi:hypothetical protein
MWITRFARIRALIREKSQDPHLQGRAAQIAGGALLADGLFGLENPLDGKKKRAGIFGNVLLIAGGVVFFLFGSFIAKSVTPYENGVMTTGTVTAVQSHTSTDADGKISTSCSAEVEFSVSDKVYKVSPDFQSNTFCGLQGSAIDVSYLPENPSGARAIPPNVGWIKSLKYIGVFVLVIAIGTTLIRLAEIIAGVWLLLYGRRRVREYPSSAPDGSLLEELRQAWGSKSALAALSTSPSASPDSSLSDIVSFATTHLAGALSGHQNPSTQATSPTQVGPPPGWYQDQEDATMLRWWDGSTWSEVTQSKPPSA